MSGTNPEPGAQGAGQGNDPGKDPGKPQDPVTGGSQGGNDPGAAFDYDKLAAILDGRQKATEESVLKGYFKDQGITGEEAAQAIQAFKDAKAAKAPDVAGMQGQIEGLRKQLLASQVQGAVVVEATKLGVDAKAIPYLARMADLTAVADEQGNVSAEKVAEAIGKVLDDIPALKPTAQQQAGFQVGGSGKKGGEPPKADDAAMRRAFGLK